MRLAEGNGAQKSILAEGRGAQKLRLAEGIERREIETR